MLDIKWIRENQDAFVKGLADRGSPEPRETLNQILKLDEQRRATIQKLQEAQARRNAASSGIGQAKAAYFPISLSPRLRPAGREGA